MEIKFKRDTAFRKQFFVPESFAHPAKMDAQLLIWLVERYTKVGETILDPMAGSGTMMLACTLGRNVICVELEDKFCKMMADNWNEVKMRPQLGSQMGECQIIQGDARQLEGLVDKIVTSPPYSNEHPSGLSDKTIKNLEQSQGRRYTRRSFTGGKEYGNSKENIGNLPYGQIDKIVTSPPYEGSVDVPDSKPEARAERLKKAGYDPKDYQGGHGRNLQQDWSYHPVDSIITSPPYEDAQATQDDDYVAKHTTGGQLATHHTSADNIGNLKSDSYLEAMLQVYQQCHSVLRPQGLMILVTKNFIRDKKIVRLDTDTVKLCEQAGFTYLERHYRKLSAQSFWRIIYKQKYPDAPDLTHEDILVFSKINITKGE